MHFNRALTPYENGIIDLICRVSQSALNTDLATFDYKLTSGLDHGMVFGELVPRNADSAKLGIQIDNEELITLYIGHHGTLVECFSKRTDTLHEMVASYVRAVIAGDYEEWVRIANGIATGAIGRLSLDGRTICIRYNTLLPSAWVRRRWSYITYQAYGKQP